MGVLKIINISLKRGKYKIDINYINEIIYISVSSFLENHRLQIVAEFSIFYNFHSTMW